MALLSGSGFQRQGNVSHMLANTLLPLILGIGARPEHVVVRKARARMSRQELFTARISSGTEIGTRA